MDPGGRWYLGRPAALVLEPLKRPATPPGGSTPAPVPLEWTFALARSPGVEHYLDTVGVGGSRPPAPTTEGRLQAAFSVSTIGRSRTAEKQRRPGCGPAAARQWRVGAARPRGHPRPAPSPPAPTTEGRLQAAFSVSTIGRSRTAEKQRRPGSGPAEARQWRVGAARPRGQPRAGPRPPAPATEGRLQAARSRA